ncbi:MAG: NAD(P)/FAD-dependent oxidoreductase [Desulfobacteraceae bacterium]|jgi:glutathione reductase (NADPH)|nr:NAD(P)/FAD-dependent oxidoreductase [Desulfobacteraceae bacterium]
MKTYDIVIVGCGTAGQTAAYYLNEKGLKVAMVEQSDRPGGVCALAGCQAKKWLYEAAETIARSRHLKGKGITAAAEGNWKQVIDQKRQFTNPIPESTIRGLEKSGIEYLKGSASFVNDDTLSVNGENISKKYVILATGARPMPLPIEGMSHIVTSDEFLELDALPQDIVFIGGGFISFEFAHFAARLGAAHQRSLIIEVGKRPLGPFDPEMADLLVEASKAEGVDIKCNVQIEKIEKQDNRFFIQTAQGNGFETDLVVHGAGRIPDLESLCLDKTGVRYSARGISVDGFMRTTSPRIFAIGDCAATIQLARVADQEGLVAAETILADMERGQKVRMDYQAVPSVLFTYPQLAMIGQTEAALKQTGQTYHRSFAKNLRWPTYRRVGLKHAAYKLLTDADNRILGAHILSDNASGMINTIRQAMLNQTPADLLYRQSIVSPYPTRESDLSYMLKPFTDGSCERFN